MNKKKLSAIVISLAATLLVVAFFISKDKLAESPESRRSTKISEPEKVETYQESADHTITADMQVVKDEDTPTLTVSSGEVENEAEKWEEKFFVDYVDETYKKLPSLKEIRKLEEGDTHHTPGLIMETGLRLGKIKKQVKLNENFAGKAMNFYRECATNSEGVTPVRGLCLANLIYLKKQKGEELDLTPFPEQVRNLAKKALEFSF